MDKPLISVIIPAYNAQKTIKRTIESALNQTFSEFELIVVNDGSQDSTLEIISSIADPRLKVFSYPNSGAAVGRNRGFSHSVGQFIAFLDADDLWTADKLEAQLKALQANPEAAVAYSWTDHIDESDCFLRECSHFTANGNVYAELLLCCFVVSGSNTLIRRQAFIDIGGFDESLPASQDFDLYLRLAARYKYVAVPAVQVLYRLSADSMFSDLHRHEATSLQVRKRAFSEAPEALPASLKRHSIANFYKCTLHRLLTDPPSRKRGIESARLLGKAIQYEPILLQKKVTVKLIYKILLFSLLSPKQAEFFQTKYKNLSDINKLLHYVRIDPNNLT